MATSLLFLFLVFPVFAEKELDQIKITDWLINNQGLKIKLMVPKSSLSLIYLNGVYAGQAKVINSNDKYSLLEFNYNNFEKNGKYILEIISRDKDNKFIEKDLIEFNYFANIKESVLEAPKLLSLKKDSNYFIITGFFQDITNTYFYLNQILIKNPVITKGVESEDKTFAIKTEPNNNKDVCIYAYLKNENKLSDKSNVLCYLENNLIKNEEKTKKSNILEEELITNNKKNYPFINIISPKNNSIINKPKIETNLFKPEIGTSIKEKVDIKELNNKNNVFLDKNSKTKTFLTSNEKFIFLIFIITVLSWFFWNNKNIIRKK